MRHSSLGWGDRVTTGARWALAETAAMLLTLAACGTPRADRPAGESWSVRTYPRAADRYARLEREFLTTADPPTVMQAQSCEFGRLSNRFGVSEAARRLEAVHDSVVRTPEERAAFRRASMASGGRTHEDLGPLCDSLNAAGYREDDSIMRAPSPRGADRPRTPASPN